MGGVFTTDPIIQDELGVGSHRRRRHRRLDGR